MCQLRKSCKRLPCQVFPGLWLASHAILEGNLAEVLMVLQEGLATAEHGDFVQRLKGD